MQDFNFGRTLVYFTEWGGEVVRADQLSDPMERIEDEIWIRSAEGEETAIDISALDFKVRPGDQVSIINAGVDGKDFEVYALLHNHRSHERGLLNDGEFIYDELIKKPARFSPFYFSLSIASIGGFFPDSWGYWVLAGIVCYICLRGLVTINRACLIEELMAYIQKLGMQNAVRETVRSALARNL
ncbi:hypothetical protein [Pseudomonas sp. EA_5y_Pfl2_R50]|uniref:hypothetical protein n=1 Tax=Pseudomonas sp. EA_5y_Pfl2_R50 TaxID=3088691 RepID=UPI0030D7319D